jgi:hypothetical protein
VIHQNGVSPNIKASLTFDQEKALLLRRREGTLSPEDQKFVSGQRDSQLDRAVDAVKSVMIYTQGGAQPQPSEK